MMRNRIGEIGVSIIADAMPIVLSDDLDLKINEAQDILEDSYVHKRHSIAGTLLGDAENKLTYTIREILVGKESCKIRGGLTRYLSVVSAHHSLEHELLLTAHRLKIANQLTIEHLRSQLPRRSSFWSKSMTQRRQFSGLSISVVLIYKTKAQGYKTKAQGYKIMVRKRSDKTAMHPNLFHVIPSCMFQPELDPKTEWNIEQCVIKEYCEELFREEIGERIEDPLHISRLPHAEKLKQSLMNGTCELLHAGITLNLSFLCPEICCVLLIHDEDWFAAQPISTNWEYVSKRELVHKRGNFLTDYHLDDVEAEFLEVGRNAPKEIVASWSANGLSAFGWA
jgi:hypothetical protein